jgi:hypothetical protein
LEKYKKIIQVILVLLLCLLQNAGAQETDSLAAATGKSRRKTKIEPYRATMLAVTLPGMGQVYNRKYWKLPFVYAGFGGLIYSASYNTSKFTEYTRAYQDFNDLVPETDSYLELIPADPSTYDPVLYPESYNPSNESYWDDRLLNGVDYYKRYRDLSYIGIAAWYLVTILDANVDASLTDFDVSDNLELALLPVMISLPGGFTGAGINLGMRWNF